LIKQLSQKQKSLERYPWKDSKKHTSEFETTIKRLNAAALSNAQYYRMSLLPRSYDERVIEPHSCGFKYPIVHGEHFKEPSMAL
jgi:hypothetical protein